MLKQRKIRALLSILLILLMSFCMFSCELFPQDDTDDDGCPFCESEQIHGRCEFCQLHTCVGTHEKCISNYNTVKSLKDGTYVLKGEYSTNGISFKQNFEKYPRFDFVWKYELIVTGNTYDANFYAGEEEAENLIFLIEGNITKEDNRLYLSPDKARVDGSTFIAHDDYSTPITFYADGSFSSVIEIFFELPSNLEGLIYSCPGCKEEYEYHERCNRCDGWVCDGGNHVKCPECAGYFCDGKDHNHEPLKIYCPECKAETASEDAHKCDHCSGYKCDGNSHGECPKCDGYFCDGKDHNHEPPKIYCPECKAEVASKDAHKCNHCSGYKCDGNSHGECPKCDGYFCDGKDHNHEPPKIYCTECEREVESEDAHKCNHCSGYKCDGNDHDECPECDGYLCDGKDHNKCPECDGHFCDGKDHIHTPVILCGGCNQPVDFEGQHICSCGMWTCQPHTCLVRCEACGGIVNTADEHKCTECGEWDCENTHDHTAPKEEICPHCGNIRTEADTEHYTVAVCGHYNCVFGNHSLCGSCGEFLCNGEDHTHAPIEITCGRCGQIINENDAELHNTLLDCGHYACETSDHGHDKMDCGHFACKPDGKDHTLHSCGHYVCSEENGHSPAMCRFCMSFTCDGRDHSHICTACGSSMSADPTAHIDLECGHKACEAGDHRRCSNGCDGWICDGNDHEHKILCLECNAEVEYLDAHKCLHCEAYICQGGDHSECTHCGGHLCDGKDHNKCPECDGHFCDGKDHIHTPVILCGGCNQPVDFEGQHICSCGMWTCQLHTCLVRCEACGSIVNTADEHKCAECGEWDCENTHDHTIPEIITCPSCKDEVDALEAHKCLHCDDYICNGGDHSECSFCGGHLCDGENHEHIVGEFVCPECGANTLTENEHKCAHCGGFACQNTLCVDCPDCDGSLCDDGNHAICIKCGKGLCNGEDHTHIPKPTPCGNCGELLPEGEDHWCDICGTTFSCREHICIAACPACSTAVSYKDQHLCSCGKYDCYNTHKHAFCPECGEGVKTVDEHLCEKCTKTEIDENGNEVIIKVYTCADDHEIHIEDMVNCPNCNGYVENEYSHYCDGCYKYSCDGGDHDQCEGCGAYHCYYYDASRHVACEHCGKQICTGNGHDECYTCGGYRCDGKNHSYCYGCGGYVCDGADHSPCEQCKSPICNGEDHGICPQCEKPACVDEHGECYECGGYLCDGNEHGYCYGCYGYVCDGGDHAICEHCNSPICNGEDHNPCEMCNEPLCDGHVHCPNCKVLVDYIYRHVCEHCTYEIDDKNGNIVIVYVYLCGGYHSHGGGIPDYCPSCYEEVENVNDHKCESCDSYYCDGHVHCPGCNAQVESTYDHRCYTCYGYSCDGHKHCPECKATVSSENEHECTYCGGWLCDDHEHCPECKAAVEAINLHYCQYCKGWTCSHPLCSYCYNPLCWDVHQHCGEPELPEYVIGGDITGGGISFGTAVFYKTGEVNSIVNGYANFNGVPGTASAQIHYLYIIEIIMDFDNQTFIYKYYRRDILEGFEEPNFNFWGQVSGTFTHSSDGVITCTTTSVDNLFGLVNLGPEHQDAFRAEFGDGGYPTFSPTLYRGNDGLGGGAADSAGLHNVETTLGGDIPGIFIMTLTQVGY